jgi:hypothetical protein
MSRTTKGVYNVANRSKRVVVNFTSHGVDSKVTPCEVVLKSAGLHRVGPTPITLCRVLAAHNDVNDIGAKTTSDSEEFRYNFE